MKILDRYLIRETLPPFLMALGIFTFLLTISPVLDYAQNLLATGVDVPTTGRLLLLLIPQGLGMALPMALLAGLLMGLGRLSGDREAVALLACGVSPLRLLRPVLILGLIVGAAELYVMVRVIPDTNQRFREEAFKQVTRRSEGDIKPGIFYEGFPGKVLRVSDANPGGGGWTGVMLADVSKPGRPVVTLADRGYLELNSERQQAAIVLPGRSTRYTPGETPGIYDVTRDQDLRVTVPAASFLGGLERGIREMNIPQLRAAEAARVASNLSPHNEIMQRHQMFSFPVACLVFAVVGLTLGLHTRKEGKLAGFTLGLGVIGIYYAFFTFAEAQTKGQHLPAHWARWVPNIAVGLLGLALLWWRQRSHGGAMSFGIPAWMTRRPRRRDGEETRGTAPGVRPQRVVLVVRVPDLPLPRFRILDVYVAKSYLRVLSLSFFGLLALYYIGTFIDKSEKLLKGQAGLEIFWDYFYYATPQFVIHVVPMAILIAVLATIGGLMRTGELVVMRACGISLYRAALPLFVLAIVWSGGLFLLDDRVLAHANRRAQALDGQIRSGTVQTIAPAARINWLADSQGRVFYYTAYDETRSVLQGLTAFETTNGPFRLTRHVEAGRAAFVNGTWRAENGWVQTFASTDKFTRQSFKTREFALPPPDHFAGLHNTDAELMTYTERRRHLEQQASSGFNLTGLRMDHESRLAFPFVTLVMTLLAVPFGVTTGRRGAMYGIGLALMFAAAYWLLNTFFAAVGHAGLLSPVLAAWAANLLFLALASYMTLTVRT